LPCPRSTQQAALPPLAARFPSPFPIRTWASIPPFTSTSTLTPPPTTPSACTHPSQPSGIGAAPTPKQPGSSTPSHSAR
jgi:hypothetical protein